MTLEETQSDIGGWQQQTFVPGYGLTLARPLLHKLREEVHELMLELYDPNEPKEKIAEEIADAFIILIAMADRLNIDVAHAVAEKMKINRARKWHPPDGNGVVNHVRE